MLNKYVIFSIAIIIGLIGAVLNLSLLFTLSIIVIFAVLIFMHFLYIAFMSNNLKSITQFLTSNIKEPSYAYILALKDFNLQEALQQLTKAEQKYKNHPNVGSFILTKHILLKDFVAAQSALEQIKNKDAHKYSEALLNLFKHTDSYDSSLTFSKQWMKYAYEATYHFLKGNTSAYERAKEHTLSHSKGVQLAANQYMFLFNEQYQFEPTDELRLSASSSMDVVDS